MKETNFYESIEELRSSAHSYSPDEYRRVSNNIKCSFCGEMHQNLQIFDKKDNSLIEDLRFVCMKERQHNINNDAKKLVFDELVSLHEYWGENNLIEMIDFCNRNQLHTQKSILIKLSKPDVIKL